MSLPPIRERLRAGPVLIADGALGGLLIGHGVPPGGCPEELVLRRPELLRAIATDYLEAGAEVVQTDTFGASPLKLSPYGLDGATEKINRRAAELVREVVDGRAYVSGSCGPCGGILRPYGEADPEEVRVGYRRQVGALIEGGIDVLFIETMIDLAEARLAVEAAREVSPDLPVAATMTFDATPRGFYTVMGNDIPACASALTETGADLVGSNCGNGVEDMTAIAREFRSATSAPLLVQPNAGVPRISGGKTLYSEDPEFMAERAREFVEIGVEVVGGCCGTTPEHVRAMREALRG